MHKIKYHALICTREGERKAVTNNLLRYLEECDVKVNLLVGQSSIFDAYNNGFNLIPDKNPNDVVILCHDDIEIYNKPEHFKQILNELSNDTRSGFIGVAGTTYLGPDCVWWDQGKWAQGKHRGFVLHGESSNFHCTFYGDYGPAAVMDGLFLAARVGSLARISLNKPAVFQGNWDFYDIVYTYSMLQLGLTNKVVPLLIRHESMGSLVGRDGWHNNRLAFAKSIGERFPIAI